jgi:hypothetical protein
MTCRYTHLDGAYLLGALAPGERQEFEQHLRLCDDCARAVGELAGLPGLLARVAPEDLGTMPDGPVPESLLPALVREVRRSQQRRGVLIAVLSAAAVTIAAVALVASGVVGDGDASETATPATSPSSAVVPAARTMVTLGGAPVRADLDLVTVAWGTRLDLACTYDPEDDKAPPRGWTYVMIVHKRDGSSQQVATWRALPGRTMRLSAATAAGLADLTWVEVRTETGRPVLKLKV